MRLLRVAYCNEDGVWFEIEEGEELVVLLVESGGEHDDLPVGPDLEEDLLDLEREAELEHAVALIQDKVADVSDRQGLLQDHLDHSTGSSDHYINALLQLLPLSLLVFPSRNQRHSYTEISAVSHTFRIHLLTQLSTRNHHQP